MPTSLQGFDGSSIDYAEAAKLCPPSSNTGGMTHPPPIKPRFPVGGSQKTVIDYLSFTTESDLPWLMMQIAEFTLELNVVVQKRGFVGYPFSATVERCGEAVGLLAWGAAHGRNLVSFSGAGCKHWNEYQLGQVVQMLRDCEARLTRVDLAFDIYSGEVTYDDVEAALTAGEFSASTGGTRVSVERFASEGEYGNKGRTLYVGSRKSSKRICIYEKGLEQFGALPGWWLANQTEETVAAHRLDGSVGVAGDLRVVDWLRLEVRYSNKDFDLGADDYAVIRTRDEYFAGAYSFCARVLGMSSGLKPPTLLTETECTLELMKMHARNSYGGLVHGLRQCGYSSDEIVQAIDAGSHSRRLVKSGIFNHQATLDLAAARRRREDSGAFGSGGLVEHAVVHSDQSAVEKG